MTCKDCIHYKVCCQKTLHVVTGMDFVYRYKYNHIERVCKDFKDRSLFVVLPCKVGDTLYTVVRGYKIREWIVTNICFSDYLPISVMVITARDKRNSEHIRFADHYLGKTVFLTREAAEQAFKGREKDE